MPGRWVIWQTLGTLLSASCELLRLVCGQEGVQLHAPLSSCGAVLQGGFQSPGTNYDLVVSQPVPASSCVR